MQNSELLPRLGARILTGDERWPNQPSAAIGPAQPFNFRSANSPLPTRGTSWRIRRGLPSGQMGVPEPDLSDTLSEPGGYFGSSTLSMMVP